MITSGMDVDVIVIGAGAAGLACMEAITSRRSATSVLIVEARDRIGGRVWSRSLPLECPDADCGPLPQGAVSDDDVPQPVTVDMGAAWLHGGTAGPNPLMSYTRDAHLYPVSGGPCPAPVLRNPWTRAAGDTLQVFSATAGQGHSSDCMSLALDIVTRARAAVGHEVRLMEREELVGKSAGQLLTPYLDRLVKQQGKLDTQLMACIDGLLYLLGAWNGGSVADLPASECSGWGLDGDGDDHESAPKPGNGNDDGAECKKEETDADLQASEDDGGQDGDYPGPHCLVRSTPCRRPSLMGSGQACLGTVIDAMADRAGVRQVAVEDLRSGIVAGPSLLLNSRVVAIDWGIGQRSSVVVVTPAGELQITARHVLLTIPVPLLASPCISFTPALPVSKVEACRAVRQCGYKKVALRYRTAWWAGTHAAKAFWYIHHEETPSALPYFQLVEDYACLKGLPVLVGVLVGSGVTGSGGRPWTLQECVQGMQQALRAVFPETDIPEPLSSCTSTWESDPLSGCGAYASATVQARDEDFEELARPLVGTHGATLHFAGDGCSAEYLGSVHGAVLSGREAADDIVQRLATLQPGTTPSVV